MSLQPGGKETCPGSGVKKYYRRINLGVFLWLSEAPCDALWSVRLHAATPERHASRWVSSNWKLSLFDVAMLSDTAWVRFLLSRVSKLLRRCVNGFPWVSQGSISQPSNLLSITNFQIYRLHGSDVVQVQFASASKNCNRDARWAGNARRRLHAAIRSGSSFSASISYAPGDYGCFRCASRRACAGLSL